MKDVTPFLWFDDQAEEAANFYVSAFSKLEGKAGEDTRIVDVVPYGESGAKAAGRPAGSVMTVTFTIGGREMVALNGGPEFHFTEAISLMVHCDTQDEVDYLWAALSEGGEEGPCGWLKDRYGLSWQIVPAQLMEMYRDPDPAKRERVMKAMLQMGKLELPTLQEAYEAS